MSRADYGHLNCKITERADSKITERVLLLNKLKVILK